MLHQILSPFLLRRLKTDVELKIPPKKEILVQAPLTALQEELYKSIVDKTILIKMREKHVQPQVEKAVEFSEGGRAKRKCRVEVDYAAMGDEKETEKRSDGRSKGKDGDLEAWVQRLWDNANLRKE